MTHVLLHLICTWNFDGLHRMNDWCFIQLHWDGHLHIAILLKQWCEHQNFRELRVPAIQAHCLLQWVHEHHISFQLAFLSVLLVLPSGLLFENEDSVWWCWNVGDASCGRSIQLEELTMMSCSIFNRWLFYRLDGQQPLYHWLHFYND